MQARVLTPVFERLLADATIPAAGVLIACPYSISVAFGNSRMAVRDSHIHGNEGALVAVFSNHKCRNDGRLLVYIFVETLQYLPERCSTLLVRVLVVV